MPDGKLFAAKVRIESEFWESDIVRKKLRSEKDFKQEVDVLKSLSNPPHDNIVQFVDEYCSLWGRIMRSPSILILPRKPRESGLS